MPFSKGLSPTVKDMWLQDQDKVIKNYKHLPHNMHYKAQTSKVQYKKLIQAKQGTKDILCENKLTNLVLKNQEE